MFPQENTQQEELGTSAKSGGKSFLFDFTEGDFVVIDGKIKTAEGIEATKVWIDKILRTERHKFRIYQRPTGEEEYGITLMDFINSNYPIELVKNEIQREIKEALGGNAEITSVYGFTFMREKRRLICTFNVETIYGQIKSEVEI